MIRHQTICANGNQLIAPRNEENILLYFIAQVVLSYRFVRVAKIKTLYKTFVISLSFKSFSPFYTATIAVIPLLMSKRGSS